MPPKETDIVDNFWKQICLDEIDFDLIANILKENHDEITFAVLFKHKFQQFRSKFDRLEHHHSLQNYPMLLFSVIAERWDLFESLLKSSYQFFHHSEKCTILLASLARGITFNNFMLLLNHSEEILDIPRLARKPLLQYAVVKGNIQIVDSLIEKGVKIDSRDKYGNSALHRAVIEGNLVMAKHLITLKTTLEIPDNYGRTALHQAVLKENLEMVKCLIQSKANLDVRDNHDQTALHLAVTFNKGCEISEYLIGSKANLDIVDSTGSTSLHLSCRNGNIQNVKLLIGALANVHILNSFQQNCLHLAVQNKNGFESFEISRLLLENGIDVNATDRLGVPPLLYIWNHALSGSSSDQLTRLLLQYGANPNLQDQFGNALHHAARIESVEIVRELIALEMDLNHKNKSGETVLSHVFRLGDDLTNPELIDLLVKNNAKLSIPHEPLSTLQLMSLVRTDKDLKEIGCYSVDWEYAIESTEITEAFIRFGFDVNEVNEKGFTPLFYAAAFGSVKVVELLIERNAMISYQNSFAFSSLHFAANYGTIENLKILVDKSKDLIDFNRLAFTALKPTFMDFKIEKNFQRMFQANRKQNVLKNRKTLEMIKWLVEEKEVSLDTNLWELACKGDFLDVFIYMKEKSNGLFLNSPFFEFICESGSTNIFKHLISTKDEFNIHAATKSAVLSASKSGNLQILQFLEKQEGMNWSSFDEKNGNNGLHIACKKGHPLAVFEILCRKIDLNSRNFQGQTPFMLACKFARFQIIKRFLEMPTVQSDLRDKNNWTAFHWSCWAGDIDIVKFLFSSKTIRVDSDSFKFAAEKGHQHIISFLASVGLQIDYMTLMKCKQIAQDSHRTEMFKLFKLKKKKNSDKFFYLFLFFIVF